MNTSIVLKESVSRESIAERVLAVIARETHKNSSELRPEATLEELDVDSVDVVMILNGIEEEFDVYLPVEQGFAEVKCLRDFIAFVTQQIDQHTRPT